MPEVPGFRVRVRSGCGENRHEQHKPQKVSGTAISQKRRQIACCFRNIPDIIYNCTDASIYRKGTHPERKESIPWNRPHIKKIRKPI